MIQMTDIDLRNKRVLIREDFNVPLENGKITSDTRIRAALPTILSALKSNAGVILISHLGRPNEGEFSQDLSLAPVAKRLEELLKKPVKFVNDWLTGVNVALGEVVLCENVRFLKGEKKSDEMLSRKMAALCDVFVMDAFATAHRAEASTYGVAQFAPIACAGPLLVEELTALKKAMQHPKRPFVAIVGGAKVSTKFSVLDSLLKIVDTLIVGGGIANTFLSAAGFPVGKSLCEPEFFEKAKKMLLGNKIVLPVDVKVGKTFSASTPGEVKTVQAVTSDDMILDIGPKTAEHYKEILQNAKTIMWNGPLGVFEFDAFSEGTRDLSLAIAESQAFSLAGGGETLAAIDKFGIADKLSYISTGGGAFLEYIEGKELPAVAILEKRAAQSK